MRLQIFYLLYMELSKERLPPRAANLNLPDFYAYLLNPTRKIPRNKITEIGNLLVVFEVEITSFVIY